MFETRYRYLFILLIAVYSYCNTLFAEVYRYYHIIVPFYAVILVFLILVAIIWEGNRLIQKILEKRTATQGRYRFLIFFFLSSIAWSAALSAIIFYLAARNVYHMTADQLVITLKLGVTLGTRINLFLQVVHLIFFFFRQYRHQQLEAEELKRAHAQAQLQAIRNQVNPHFLFNNLNVLATLIMQERREANTFIEEFSIVYRHVLNSQQRELVTVGEELEFMEHYLFLLSHRFPRSIRVDIRIETAYRAFLIVPMALQMLVENAIKHNIVSADRPLEIDIYVDGEERLVVSNILQLRKSVDRSTRIGLNNIDQRYRLISQKTITVSASDVHFSVMLPLIKAPS